MSGKMKRNGLGIRFFEGKNTERQQYDASQPTNSLKSPLPPHSARHPLRAIDGEVDREGNEEGDTSLIEFLRSSGPPTPQGLRSVGPFLPEPPRQPADASPPVAPSRYPSNTSVPSLPTRISDSSSAFGSPYLSQRSNPTSTIGSPSPSVLNSDASSNAATSPLPPRKSSANYAFTPSLRSKPSIGSFAVVAGTPAIAASPPLPPLSKKRGISSGVHTPAHIARKSDASSKAASLIGRKLDPDLDADPLDLIEVFLTANLREQAETFVRKSSSSSTPRVDRQSTPRNRSGTATLFSPQPRDQHRPPTQNSSGNSAGRTQRSNTYSGPNHLGITRSESGPEVCGTSDIHYRSLSTGLSPKTKKVTVNHNPHLFITPGSRIVKKLPRHPTIRKRPCIPSDIFPYFTEQQEAENRKKVYSKKHSCERHENCTDCINIEFAFLENQIMSTSIPADERQKIIANNKSLRTIKNELDNLLDNGMISEEIYATITDALPSETSLNAASRRNAVPSTPTPDPNPLSTAINNMRLNSSSEPPSYNASATNAPPALPGRTPSQPERPVIGRATALYPYEGAPEDCGFAIGHPLEIYEYMNADWCYGKNTANGRQGLFPINYVQLQPTQPTPNSNVYGAYGNNEKQNGYGGYPAQQQQQQQGPPPPGPSNPYNSAVPPMQIAEQPVEGKPGKGAEMGKKFGKKLGNAAIFGAGATIGGNIVNSIF